MQDHDLRGWRPAELYLSWMAGIQQSMQAEILLSCIEENYFQEEVVLDHHSFARIISGEMKVVQGEHTYHFLPGDSLLFPGNQLSTLSKSPKDGLPYKAIVIFFTPERLQAFYADTPIQFREKRIHKIRMLKNDPLFESFFASLIPYFKLKDKLPAKLVSIKIAEALTILRSIDKDIDGILADFSTPNKINITDFMEKNFMLNMTIEKFGILTGRSLTTFKRDFKKAFNTTPQKWILTKRLELAHYKLAEKRQKPVDVYLESGFENLSHFSYAFKKHFGYPPTELTLRLSSS